LKCGSGSETTQAKLQEAEEQRDEYEYEYDAVTALPRCQKDLREAEARAKAAEERERGLRGALELIADALQAEARSGSLPDEEAG
jgi:hypothetical protein